MKVGDLVKFRRPETDDENTIALVVDKISHGRIFKVLDLSGSHKGLQHVVVEDDWEVISESR